MATITTTTMDDQTITQFFLKTAGGGLRQLPFVLVTIDSDFQAYQPITGEILDSNLRPMRGKFTPPVILDRNSSLPRGDGRTPQEAVGVFEYDGY